MEGVEAESGAPAMDPLMQYYRSHNQHLFSVQLEFICSLANPSYITFISQEGYLQDKRFLRYLEHLYSTWREPKMARFVRYPYGLYFLECLQRPEFRQAVAQEGWEARAKSQIIAHWATWRKTSSEFRPPPIDQEASTALNAGADMKVEKE